MKKILISQLFILISFVLSVIGSVHFIKLILTYELFRQID